MVFTEKLQKSQNIFDTLVSFFKDWKFGVNWNSFKSDSVYMAHQKFIKPLKKDFTIWNIDKVLVELRLNFLVTTV